MMGEQPAVFAGHAEDANRQTPDRARHRVAVEIERGEAWRLDTLERVHLHAVDDGEKTPPRQAEVADWLREACHQGPASALVEGVPLSPPFIELRKPF